ncbi:conserved hypothetical protein [Tenacibaculum sediminilitoris]|uniref:Ig-like domain-containing protein n=1 Tax=Tenacibaculum sediminilitoris TaxID=1820334 RepID=UPI003896737C
MIKNKQTRRTIAIFFLLNFLSTLFPYNGLYANNNGPNAPEASGFEPVNATDMVNLSSGDMAYVLPLLEVDGFPITLSYHAGIPMEMEASWTGLGWNINTGSIARGVVATPDDWKNGRRLNITYLHGTTKSYSVDVGVGIGKAASVGVGLSWGPNKSLSGSVSASIGIVSVSADTNGRVGASLSASTLTKSLGFKGAFDKISEEALSSGVGFGGSLSVSNKGGFSATAGLSSQSKGLSTSMGVSISGQGIGGAFSIGGNNGVSGSNALGGSGSMNMGSFSAGDFSINTKGIYIPINIGILSFGFGYQKVDIKLRKAYNKFAYGSLYLNSEDLYSDYAGFNNSLGELAPDNVFKDYQKRNRIGDAYEQIIPQTEEEFISDYRKQIEKLNFTFAGYDSYNINATGVSGSLRPIIGENSVIIGEGYDGGSTFEYNKKAKVFYHNSYNTLRSTKSINNNLYFSFDGQITENAIVGKGNFINATGSSDLTLGDFINNYGNKIQSRPKAGSFIEVFSNEQIDNGANIIHPSSSFNENGNKISRYSLGYQPKGIGAYKITTPDGKTYHFSQPVYQYEQIQHNFLKFEDADWRSPYNSQSKREATPYATHWLLTAITGPDYVDNGNKFPDKDDLGYWVRLDHGQWSSAYTWRSPYDTKMYTQKGTAKHYSTYVDNEVEKSDPGHFMQGRKDLYYLDKIVSRERIAYFVKDIRYDAIGTNAPYIFYPTTSTSLWNNNIGIDSSDFNDVLEGPTPVREYARYEKEYQLKLDKIVLTKNDEALNVSSNASQKAFKGLEVKELNNQYEVNSFFESNLGGNAKVHKLHQSNKIIDIDDFINFDYENAFKVIKFNYDYSLAYNTPSSDHPNNPNKGRLTLKEIATYGRGMFKGAKEHQLYDYLPPYKFSYYKGGSEATGGVVYKRDEIDLTKKEIERANVDNWGFINGKDGKGINKIDAWSLASIKNPQGSTIDIKYEEDDFKIEAFSRRHWSKNLAFKVSKVSSNRFKVQIQNHANISDLAKVKDFNDFFEKGERVFLDLYLCYMDEEDDFADWSDNARGAIDIRADDIVTVEDIKYNSNGVQVMTLDVLDTGEALLNSTNTVGVYGDRTPNLPLNWWFDDVGRYTTSYFTCESMSNDVPTEDCPYGKYSTYAKDNNLIRNQCPGDLDGDHYNLVYRLLANKIVPGSSGGGLRVKEIVVKDEQNNEYITEYDYNDPSTGKTSGITSFNPVKGEVFVPYQNELPGPGVMYEWVTMKAYGKEKGIKKLNTKMRYHYYTLQPVWDIFDPNIVMKDKDGQPIFEGKVEEVNMSQSGVTAKKINIKKNLSKIGQLISTEEFNEYDQLLNKTENFYKERTGEVSETFTSMKSVFDFSTDNEGNIKDHSLGILKGRYLTLSSKSEKVHALNKIDNYALGAKSTVEYFKPDAYLGTYTEIQKTKADGTKVRETKYPAYTFYSEMGSKIENPLNKNMLTQEAMNVTAVEVSPNVWKTTNASVTTWNNEWIYRDIYGEELMPTSSNEKIWRKHKNFIWKGTVDEHGTYGKFLNQNSFNWGIGATQINAEWEEVSEITRYTHFSLPIEAKDINGNYASSKMDTNFSKTIAGGNAQYTEMYYSGLEEYDSRGKESEFVFENTQLSDTAHTGESAVVVGTTSKAFKLTIDSRNGSTLLGKKFRPGAYKVSYWLYTPDREEEDVPNSSLVYGTQNIASQEKVKAGDWTLVNHIITVIDNSNLELYLINNNSSKGEIVDDFRIHPIASTMNSYVYDKNTDELRFILDANNLATEFKYDKAGRLCKTFKEVLNQETNTGGFKLLKEYRYRYKNAPTNSGMCGCCEEDGVVYVNDAPTAMSDNYQFKIVTNEALTLDVLANDYDLNSLDVLTVDRIVSPPSYGAVAISNNKIVYTPKANFYGQDSFTYSIKDNGTPAKTSNTATVNISLTEDTFFPLIKITDFVDVGHKACTTFKVTIAGGSGSFTYVWKKIDYNDNVVSTYTGNSDYYVCTSCSANEYYQISCTITDNVSGKVKTVNSATGPCGGSMGDGPVLEEPK